MTKEEAAAKLVEVLPETAQVTRAHVRHGDVIVIECEGPIRDVVAARITEYVNSVWPDNKAIVLSDGMKLKIARSE